MPGATQGYSEGKRRPGRFDRGGTRSRYAPPIRGVQMEVGYRLEFSDPVDKMSTGGEVASKCLAEKTLAEIPAELARRIAADSCLLRRRTANAPARGARPGAPCGGVCPSMDRDSSCPGSPQPVVPERHCRQRLE